MNDAEKLEEIKKLHRPVQYKGWRKLLKQVAHEPLAFTDKWCFACRTEFPCETVQILTSD